MAEGASEEIRDWAIDEEEKEQPRCKSEVSSDSKCSSGSSGETQKQKPSEDVDGSLVMIHAVEETCWKSRSTIKKQIIPDFSERDSDPMTIYASDGSERRLCVKNNQVLLQTNTGIDDPDCETEFILKDQQTIETEGMRGQLSTKQGNNIGIHIPDVNFPRKAELKVLNGVKPTNTEKILREVIVNEIVEGGTAIFYPTTNLQRYYIVPSINSTSVNVELEDDDHHQRPIQNYRCWSHNPSQAH